MPFLAALLDRTGAEFPDELGYPWDWDPIEDLVAHADRPDDVVAVLDENARNAIRAVAGRLAGTSG